jgi:hypothetical protein
MQPEHFQGVTSPALHAFHLRAFVVFTSGSISGVDATTILTQPMGVTPEQT